VKWTKSLYKMKENKRNEISHRNHAMFLTAKSIREFQIFIINNAITLILNIYECIKRIQLYIYS